MSWTLGPSARFGPVTVLGAERVDPVYVLRPALDLRRTGGRAVGKGTRKPDRDRRFSSAAVSFGDQVEADGLLPVTVTVTEPGKRGRSGLGSALRRMWACASRRSGVIAIFLVVLSSSACGVFGEVETGITADFRIPDVIFNDQDLLLDLSYLDEKTDGYNALGFATSARFERRVSDILSIDYGISLERTTIDDDGVEDIFTLVGLPIGASIDTSDDLLNPTVGGRTRLSFTPFLEEVGSTVGFAAFTPRPVFVAGC